MEVLDLTSVVENLTPSPCGDYICSQLISKVLVGLVLFCIFFFFGRFIGHITKKLDKFWNMF